MNLFVLGVGALAVASAASVGGPDLTPALFGPKILAVADGVCAAGTAPARPADRIRDPATVTPDRSGCPGDALGRDGAAPRRAGLSVRRAL